MTLYCLEILKNEWKWDVPDISESAAVEKSAMCRGKINETLQIGRNDGGSSVKKKCRNIVMIY